MILTFAGREIRLDNWIYGQQGGLVVLEKGLTGWLDSPEIRREQIDRLGHGSFATPATLSDRLVEVEGLALADSWRKLSALRDNLVSMQLVEDEELLTLQIDGESRYAKALPTGGIKWEADPYQCEARFRVSFWCPDPWIFGDSRVYKGTAAQPRQFGTVNAYPTVKFAGDFGAGFRLVVGSGGGTFEYSKPASGAVLDTRSMALTSSSGALLHTFSGLPPVVRPYDPAPAWWSVDAKSKPGVIEVTVADTYI
ncbi:hypothetical protein JRG19_02585 [Pseudoclavibacter alba]|uniref:hypothetical protein n=1 Tax=Pseudoclavibacter albus TaxID=272241 RepID=UPI0019D31641|nr:hypothetical protein [Pseudoclavibacter alba]MBN6777437.1 hypothetical protein [Pseudoclavibacter alba]